VKKYRRYYW